MLAGDFTPEDFRLRRADGGWQWMAATIRVTHTSEGMVLVGSLRDVQSQVEIELELEHLMGHDPVTGLATRSVMINRIAGHLEALDRADESVGVMCVAVDSLGTINGAYSHDAGDRVLAGVANRMAETLGDPDRLARGAGNELFVVIPRLRSGADAGEIADRLRSCAAGPLKIGEGQVVAPTVSIGIATAARGADPKDMLREAGLAMRQAKRNGRNCYEFLDAELAAQAEHDLKIEAGIREGLTRREFTVHYQPIVALDTGATVGHEGLIRWQRASGLLEEAWKFLPVAERGLLIADLDLIALGKAIAELSRTDDGTIAVNVSAASLRIGRYDAEVTHLLNEYGVDAHRLHLEVTETALLSITDTVKRVMSTIADLGVAWYVDDFGTGYSSISHLRDLPIAGLKLDRSFTMGIGAGDNTCLRLADGLVGLAAGLGLDTVAEGVETSEQASLLVEQGWLKGQGWLYGRPEQHRAS